MGSNPGGGEFFLTHPDRLWNPKGLLYNGYRVFPRGIAARVRAARGRGARGRAARGRAARVRAARAWH